MESPHPLKALLQLQLASDAYAALHLPYILATLTSDCFLPSPHLQKWTARVSSLLHSKDPAARWAGLAIAHKTARFSKPIMLEYGPGWLAAALPFLSVRVLYSPSFSNVLCSVPWRKTSHRLSYMHLYDFWDTFSWPQQMSQNFKDSFQPPTSQNLASHSSHWQTNMTILILM